MATDTKTKKSFNPTITAMFKTGNGNYMSPEQDDDQWEEIRAAVSAGKRGDALFLKKSPKLNSAGKETYFLEVVTPSKFKKPTRNEAELD